ncbi:biotin transporter BioY [Thermosynechococcus sp. HN-54]|uniref:biotin transporter BioY n=1 Tax=Thermosynechococcus sp. HN-54 TaxID=2933959 RepID=UPI00202CF56A|nr:biotin transporter BioY [Thermosynechococcus sp. HN-54]URR35116.1 biotin transporter BioY [Thermosynechococcus sp. HN-54]
MSPLDEFLWAILGLLLTVAGTFMEAAIAIPNLLNEEGQFVLPSSWAAVPVYSLPVSYQVAAVLLVGCMGGRQAAVLSQVAYLILGLSGFQVFSQGGGLDYWREPTFGYLLGFVPGAWVCGWLAFRPHKQVSLEWLALSGLAGLVLIHVCGAFYLGGLALAGQLSQPLVELLEQYSLFALPGQLVIVCLVAAVARVLRLILLY